VKGGPRRKRLEELKGVPATLLLFETGSRLAKSLADMAAVLGPREAAIAKELTKLHETITRGTLGALAASIEAAAELKGEFVVVIAPPAAAEGAVSDEAVVAALEQALGEMSFRDAVREVAERFDLRRSRVYELGLALERSGDGAT
jgi:16S rRNA (cytidine1402-2'-O)-methyltransferase